VGPALIVRDNEGKSYSVRYDQVKAMLLDEFLKDHRKVEKQAAMDCRPTANSCKPQKNARSPATNQQKKMDALRLGFQKISAEIGVRVSEGETNRDQVSNAENRNSRHESTIECKFTYEIYTSDSGAVLFVRIRLLLAVLSLLP
jgi:hypothetical protein